MGEIDHEYTNDTVCPYCGYEESDSWELEGDSGKDECGRCKREYWYERHVDVTYVTRKLDGGATHDR